MEMEKKNKKEVRIAGLVVTLAVLAMVAYVMFLVFSGVKEPVVTVTSETITIDCKYGVSFPVSEVTGVTLIDKSMEEIGIGNRNNGYGGIGTTLLGRFDSEALGKYLLYVESDAAPVIWIDRAGSAEDVYLSFRDSAKTQAVYAELAAVVPKG